MEGVAGARGVEMAAEKSCWVGRYLWATWRSGERTVCETLLRMDGFDCRASDLSLEDFACAVQVLRASEARSV